jgi:gliding motility-associated-like protein
LAEGPETVILTLDTLNCFGGSATLTIQDPFKADAGPDLTLCSGQQATVGATSVPDVAYNWQAAFGLQPPYNIAQPTVGLSTLSTLSYNYLLTTTDLLNGCVDSDTVNVTYVPLPKANFTMASDICVDATTTITFSQIQVPGLVYNWDFDNPSLVNGSGAGPYVVSWNTPGIKTVTLFVEDQGCLSPVITKTITVHPIPTSTFLATATVCANQSSQVTYTGSASPNAIFTWDFDGGTGGTGTGPFNVQWNTPGTKTISLMVEEFGCVSNTTIQQVVVNEVPTADFNAQSSVCEGDQSVITYTGTATANAGYAWDFDGGTIISGTAGGPYTVSWPFAGAKTVCLQVQENGCISSLVCETVNVQATPVAGIAPVSNQCFNGNSFDFVYTGDANVTSYAWLFGADATPAISTSATPPSVSYLNPGIKTVALVVTRNGCVSDTAFATFEVVEDPVSDFSASTTGACFEECITYNFTGYSPGIQMTYLWDFGQDATPASSSQPAPPCVDYNSSGTKTVTLTVNFKGCVDQSVQTVTIHPGPIVNGGGDVAFCDGEGGAQIDASVTGGTTPYYYSWWCQDPTGAACGLSGNFIEDPIVNPIVTPNAPDSMVYYFQVTDFNGCTSNIDSVTAIVKAKPKMDAGPDVAICKEGPGAFLQGGVSSDNRAPLPIDYQWLPATGLNNPNVPNPFARPAETTIYTLLGTSVNGCASEVTTLDTLSTVTVHVNDLPVAEAGADTAICLNDSVQLAGSASMAGPNYSYTWTPAIAGTIDDPNSPSPFVKPSFTTTYYLVVTSNGCDSYADSVEVIVDTKPTLSPGSDESICQGDSVKLNGLASGDPFGSQYSYEWTPTVGLSDPGQGDPLAGPKQTTTYTVVATSEHGCGSDAKSILVTVESTPIVFILKPDTVVCEGDEINLFADHGFKTPSATPVVYDWQPQDGSIISSPFVKSIQIVPATTTIYSVTATAPSGCATTDEVLVTVNPRVEATLSADTTQFCEGLATRLYAAGGLGNAEVQWLPSTGLDDSTSFNPFASPSENTTYQVVITEGACSDTAAVSLTINPAPIPDYFASQDAGCAGLEVSFMENATNGTNFLWDFGDGSPVNNEVNPSHVYAEPGSYPVTLTAVGPGGCEADITKTVVEVSDGAFADFSSSPEAMNEIPLPGATVQFTDLSANGVSWYWDFGDGNVSTAQNPTHTYAQAGEYGVSLTVTDGNGCTSTIQYGPYIIFNPDLMIPNLFSPNGDGTNDRFVVQYTGNESFMLEIFDRWGRTVFTSDAVQDAWEGQDSGGGLAREGVYYYSLQIGERMYNGHVTLLR